MTQSNLEAANIKKRSVKGCGCLGTAFVYTLPFGLGSEALQYLQAMGMPAVSFEKTSLLKIENADFSITGIKRLKDVRLTLKDAEKKDLITTFEENLIKYVENQIIK
jgi:hypothetical protein